jgi:clathrin heavy chain
MNEDVTFWSWINDSTLGVVTEREVHHWKVTEGQAAPQKVSGSTFSLGRRQFD